jgi:Fur family ferric uptake transcriptional regulator
VGWVSKPPATRPSPAGSVEEVLALVKEQGGRATSARRVLLEVLFETDGHLTAEQLGSAVQERIPDVHISTVYRNLDDLERMGVVSHSHVGHGPSTFQLAGHAHGHFLCKECGSTLEAPDELFAGLSRTVQSRLGFRIDPHHFAMLGTCRACGG